jgi:hypothetical protein
VEEPKIVPQPGGNLQPGQTRTGEPHPLVASSYDGSKDPGIPGGMSDLAAHGSGLTTKAQADALAEIDVPASLERARAAEAAANPKPAAKNAGK